MDGEGETQVQRGMISIVKYNTGWAGMVTSINVVQGTYRHLG
jgi:hypothetical protein